MLLPRTNETKRPSGLNATSSLSPGEEVRRVIESASNVYRYTSLPMFSRTLFLFGLKFHPRALANPAASSADTPAIFFAAASSFAALKRTRLLPVSVSITACSTTLPSSTRGQAKVLSSSQLNPNCGVPPNDTRCLGSKMFSSVSSRMVGFGCGVVLTSCASAVTATNRRRAAEQFFNMAAIYTPRKWERGRKRFGTMLREHVHPPPVDPRALPAHCRGDFAARHPQRQRQRPVAIHRRAR